MRRTDAPLRSSRFHFIFVVLTCLLAIAVFISSARATGPSAAWEPAGVRWEMDSVYAVGHGVVPDGTTGAQGRLLARRAAIVDLQRNLLEYIEGVRIDSRTVMNDFLVSDVVRSSVQGTVRHVAIHRSDWSDGIYTVFGSVPLAEVRRILTPEISGFTEKEHPVDKGTGYSELVIDLGDMLFDPSLIVRMESESGRRIYGPEFIDKKAFVDRGMCRYEESLSRILRSSVSSFFSAFTSGKPAWADETRTLLISESVFLSEGGTIILSDEIADVIEKNSYDFRIPGNVTIITKTAALRGETLSFPIFAELKQ